MRGNVADCVSKQRAVGPSARLSNADEKERRLDQENQSEEEELLTEDENEYFWD